MPARARHANLQTRDPERYPARHVGERGMGWLRAMTYMRIVAWVFLSVPEGDLDPVAFKSQHYLVQAEALVADFEASGLSLSCGDKFAIAAAQTLVNTHETDLGYDAMHRRLAELRVKVMDTGSPG